MSTDPKDGQAPAREAQVTPAENSPFDAPTIFVDALQGAMVSDSVVKLFFLEQIAPVEGGDARGRYVLNLVTNYSQLRELGEVMLRLADDYERARSSGEH